MHTKFELIFCGAVILCNLIGCSKNEIPAYETLSPNAILVKVNDHALTKARLEAELGLRAQMYIEKKPNVTYQQALKFRNNLKATAIGQFVGECLFSDYAHSKGAQVTDADRDSVINQILKSYAKTNMTFEAYKAKLKRSEAALLDEAVERQALARVGRTMIVTNFPEVTAADIARRRQELADYNRRVAATNAATYAFATNVWNLIRKTGKFKESIEIYAANPHVAAEAEWGTFKASQFKNDLMTLKYVVQSPKCTVTPPFEGDNGLMIMKILDIIPADPDNGRKEKEYVLGRIFFDLALEWDDKESDADLKEGLEKLRRRDAFRSGVERLKANARISYPFGENYLTPEKKESKR